MSAFTSEKTLIQWFHLYYHDDPTQSSQKHIFPFLNVYPEVVTQITDFAQNNLFNLFVELLHCHTIDVILPKLVEKVTEETNNPNLISSQLLHHYYLY